MLDRKRILRLIGLAAALSLLISMIAAPVRSVGFGSVPGRPDRPRRNFAVPVQLTKQLRAVSSKGMAGPIRALLEEEEDREDDRFAATVAPDWPNPPSPRPSRESIARVRIDPGSARANHPLRC